MHHTKADTDRTYVNRNGRRALLQTEATYKGVTLSKAEYMNKKYQEGQFVYTVKIHERNQPNVNSLIKIAAKVAEEINQQ
jgi:hypothetical protein